MSMYSSEDVRQYEMHTMIQQELMKRRLQSYIRRQGYNPKDPKIVSMQTRIVWLSEEAELAHKLWLELETCHD